MTKSKKKAGKSGGPAWAAGPALVLPTASQAESGRSGDRSGPPGRKPGKAGAARGLPPSGRRGAPDSDQPSKKKAGKSGPKDSPEAVRERTRRNLQREKDLLGIVPVTVRVPEADRDQVRADAAARRQKHLEDLIADPATDPEAQAWAKERLNAKAQDAGAQNGSGGRNAEKE